MATIAGERIQAAIGLRKPDRVPVVPMIDFFASRYGGITQEEMFFDIRRFEAALQRTLHALGPIDGVRFSYAGMGRFLLATSPVPPRLLGVGGVAADGLFRYVEESIMGPAGYREIGQSGFLRFPLWFFGKLKINHPELANMAGFVRSMGGIAADFARERRSEWGWRKRGVGFMVGLNLCTPPLEF